MTKRTLHGWLVLDKPTGITSAHAVSKVKRLTRCAKIGHAGTLDPLASGVLPLALGEATKLFNYIVGSGKEYCFTVKWGEERDTDDSEGVALRHSPHRPSLKEIKALLPEFTGEIAQLPPAYSAIKVQGRRAYDLAREGELPALEPRFVTIHNIQLVEHESDGSETRFAAYCGKGAYIRAIARDMGRKLGCFGHITAIRRLSVGNFTEKDAISLDKLEALVHNAPPNEWLRPVESALDDILAVTVDSNASEKLKAGRPVVVPLYNVKDSTAYARSEGKLIAMGKVSRGMFTPARVFNY